MSPHEDDNRVEVALKYLDRVKNAFSDRSQMYDTFLKIMKCFKHEEIDAATMIEQVSLLFGDQKELILGLNMFLPDGCRIVPIQKSIDYVDGEKKRDHQGDFLFEDKRSSVSCTKENGNQQQQQQQAAMEPGQEFDQEPIENDENGAKSSPNQDFVVERRSIDNNLQSNEVDANQYLLDDIQQGMDSSDANTLLNPETCPEYDCAIDFVVAVKERFANDPASFQGFFELLHSHDGKPKPIDEILIGASKLFSSHQDLLKDFRDFLRPDITEIISKAKLSSAHLKRSSLFKNIVEDEHIAVVKLDRRNRRRHPQVVEAEEMGPPTQMQGRPKRAPQVSIRPSLVDMLPLAALHNQQEDANDSLGTTLVQPPSLKRKYSNASERKKGGVSKGRNKAKPKGKTGQKESGGTKIDENSRTTGYQLFDADYSTVPTEPSSSQRRSKRLIRGKKGRSRAAAAAGIDNGLPLSTTTVDGGSAVENFVYSQCKGDSFLLKAKDAFNRRCKLAWEDFLVCLELYSSNKMARHVLIEVIFDLCGGDRVFYKHFLDFLGRYTIQNDVEPYNADEIVDHNAPIPLNKLDFSECCSCTPSYRELPSGYPQSYCSAKGKLEKNVLNDRWVSVPVGSEGTGQFKQIQQNPAEMRLFEFEADRFEMDMLISVGLSTIAQLEPILTEIKVLEKIEKHYDLKEDCVLDKTKLYSFPIFANFNIAENALDRVHFTMIRRLYGGYGKQIVANLKNNPREVVPVILRRLKKKVNEWSDVQKKNPKWDDFVATTFASYFDHQSESFKLYSRSLYSSKELFKGLRQLAWPHDKGEPLHMQVTQDVSLRKIFASDVNALLNIVAGSDVRFISHSLKAQTDALKHIDLASGGFISFLMSTEDPYLSEHHIQIQNDLDLSDFNIQKPSNHHSEFDEGEENMSKGSEGGSSGNGVVCSYVGTEEVYLVIRLYLLFMSKLETAWILCQGAELRQDSHISNPHKTIVEHAKLTQFTTGNSNLYCTRNSTPEMFTSYRAFLGLVGALLGRIIHQEMYEESIRQLMGNDSYKFLFLHELASECLLHLSRTASKSVLINKFGTLARYERLSLIQSGIPLTWNGTILKARKIVNSFRPSYFDFSVHGLYVMLIEQNGSLEFRHVTALEVPGNKTDGNKNPDGGGKTSHSK